MTESEENRGLVQIRSSGAVEFISQMIERAQWNFSVSSKNKPL